MDGYQLKISVNDSSTPIWRKVEVPASYSFVDMHQLIQTIFGLNELHIVEFEFRFENNDGKFCVSGYDFDKTSESELEIVHYFDEIKDYFKTTKTIEYYYDFDDDWRFLIEIEKELTEVNDYPQVIDYSGNNLIEDCGGIKSYEAMIAVDPVIEEEISFDIKTTNDLLRMFEASETLNSSEFKNEFIKPLKILKDLVKERNIADYQVIKLVAQVTTYWVILKTIEGYVIELFENYNDLLEGFYNLPSEGINNAFCNCWTFLLSDHELSEDVTLDEEHLFAALKNEPGYIPELIELKEAKEVYGFLKELIIAIRDDDNISENDEIIEIIIENGAVKERSIFVHEPKVDFKRYNHDYFGNSKLEESYMDSSDVSLDVVALPSINTAITNELSIYAIIAGQDDYLIKEATLPTLRNIGEALIDVIIEYSNSYGKPARIVINNLNVLFLVWDFINKNGIEYLEDEIAPEIEAAIVDAFGFEKTAREAFDNPYIEELLEQLDGKSEEEIEDKLNEILANMELLN